MCERRTRFWRSIVDWLLIAGIVALLSASLLFAASNPRWWSWCLDTLDLRNWTHWTWTGVGAALLGVLVLIRVWPEKKR